MLLHGNGESCRIFDMLVEELPPYFKCYALDSRCHGKSQHKVPLGYSLMADDVAGFIKELKLEKPVVIGFSDGGIVALLLAVNYPELAEKIICVGANATPDGLHPMVLKILRLSYFLTRSKKVKLMLTEPNITAEQLQSIETPSVFIAGEKDIIRQEHTRFIADNVRNSVCEIVENATHSDYVVNSPRFYEILKKYL